MPEKEMDVDTKAIHDFNKKVNDDKRVTNLLLPVRDGLMLMMKN
jgi:caffeoyl-CoA O-methyltransferase